MASLYKVLLVDDHVVVRSGLRRLLEMGGTIEIVAEADSGEMAYQMYIKEKPDIVLMDLSMPGMGGLEAARRIMRRDRFAKVIIFSMHETASFVTQALKAGVRGYVTKAGNADDLIQAVNEVGHGRTFISVDIAQKIALQTLVGDDDPVKLLSTREFEVFRLLVAGHKIEDVSEMLKISQKTVANYFTMIKQKLDVATPIDMVRLAMRHGLVEEN